MEMCHCGEPLHYKCDSKKRMVEALIEKNGQFLDFTFGDKTYKIPRHYAALHDIRPRDFEKLGFSHD